jgi:hypothetical protein
MVRYRDGYLVGRAANTAAVLIKTAGLLTAAMFFFAVLYVNQYLPEEQRGPVFILGLVFAAFFGGVSYVVGVMVGAVGQVVYATIDTAVNTSPSLSESQRAQVMGI